MNEKPNNFNRVKILSEALPYIQRFHDKVFVIKYGGSALKDPELEASTIKDLILLNSVGIKVILVHGGGPEINQMLSKVGKAVEFENGLRKTDQETMEVVEMVLHGKVQRRLVTAINCAGARAIGISGRDARIVTARRHSDCHEGNHVGEVASTDIALLEEILKLGLIPVISSIAPDKNGIAYNLNADTMAAAIAQAIKADKLILMTDTAGILKDKDKPETLYSELTATQARNLIKDDIVQGGMIPKVECCLNAGVSEAIILNGLQKHSLLLETFTNEGAGTLIRS